MHSDGTFVGRSAPEIDVFEAQVSNAFPRVLVLTQEIFLCPCLVSVCLFLGVGQSEYLNRRCVAVGTVGSMCV